MRIQQTTGIVNATVILIKDYHFDLKGIVNTMTVWAQPVNIDSEHGTTKIDLLEKIYRRYLYNVTGYARVLYRS
jgi:hypothetical protein